MYSNEIYPIKIAFLQEPLGMTPKRIALEKHGLSENQNVGLNWNNGKKNLVGGLEHQFYFPIYWE